MEIDSEEHEETEIERQGNVDIEVKRSLYSTISVHNTSFSAQRACVRACCTCRITTYYHDYFAVLSLPEPVH